MRLLRMAAFLCVFVMGMGALQAQANLEALKPGTPPTALIDIVRRVTGDTDLLEDKAVSFVPDADAPFCVFLAKLPAGDATARTTGRLLGLLAPVHGPVAENVLTMRLVLPADGGRDLKVALNTVGAEGDELGLVSSPNDEWQVELMAIPAIPEQFADSLAEVGEAVVGAVKSPRGLHIVFGRKQGEQTRAVALLLPAVQAMADHGVEWNAAE